MAGVHVEGDIVNDSGSGSVSGNVSGSESESGSGEEFVIEACFGHQFETYVHPRWKNGILSRGDHRRLRLTIKWEGFEDTSFECIPENTSLKSNAVVCAYLEKHHLDLNMLKSGYKTVTKVPRKTKGKQSALTRKKKTSKSKQIESPAAKKRPRLSKSEKRNEFVRGGDIMPAGRTVLWTDVQEVPRHNTAHHLQGARMVSELKYGLCNGTVVDSIASINETSSKSLPVVLFDNGDLIMFSLNTLSADSSQRNLKPLTKNHDKLVKCVSCLEMIDKTQQQRHTQACLEYMEIISEKCKTLSSGLQNDGTLSKESVKMKIIQNVERLCVSLEFHNEKATQRALQRIFLYMRHVDSDTDRTELFRLPLQRPAFGVKPVTGRRTNERMDDTPTLEQMLFKFVIRNIAGEHWEEETRKLAEQLINFFETQHPTSNT